MPTPILDAASLTRTHTTAAGPLTVLDNVTFSIPEGQTCAITGPSGSGKTTLLGLCAGLDLPTAGFVRIAGQKQGTTRLRVEGAGLTTEIEVRVP